jgi:hypothetical protein
MHTIENLLLSKPHRDRDPPTPLLASSPLLLADPAVAQPSTPILSVKRAEGASPTKNSSSRRQPRSPPRAKKVSLLKLPNLSQKMKNQRLFLQGSQVKRIYPRAVPTSAALPEMGGILGKKIREAKLKNLMTMSNE